LMVRVNSHFQVLFKYGIKIWFN